ncbi:TssA family type VI secretion system protein [Vibrio sp. S4M6]|uniref:TssA family type VI secretion system protein n=1 Tax=Vibrio sinus TaxID=2946865 RepID=UPI002029F8B4|nr:TssA family type VI secretion system protein [Vibrio sinus]MCL9782498.1 TssA family type VI secretion system protein [Vibrio sinus]
MSDIISQLGVEPISELHPAGINISDIPEAEHTLAEVGKLNAMDQGPDAVNWVIVDRDIQNLLSQHGKHFQFAAYLAVARCQIDGLSGVTQGANLLKGITENFWEDAYPPKKRVRGRINAIQWWLDWTNNWAEKFVQSEEKAHSSEVQSACDAVQGLEYALVDKYDDAPVMRSLMNHLNRVPLLPESENQGDTTQPDEIATGKSDDNAKQSRESDNVALSSAVATSIIDEDNREPHTQVNCDERAVNHSVPDSQIHVDKSSLTQMANNAPSQDIQTDLAEGDQAPEALLEQGLGKFRSSAERLFKQDPKLALSYRLRRIAAWGKMLTVPSSVGAVTHVSPPSWQDESLLESAKNTGDAMVWLSACENTIATNPFWLDLSYQSLQILSGLGSGYADAKNEIEKSCRDLVSRFPEIILLKYNDERPFASLATQDWLTSLDKSAVDTGVDNTSEIEAKANALVTSGQVEQALGLLNHALIGGAPYDQFRLKLRMAQILQQDHCTQLALTQIASSLEQIQQYRLDLWQPELALSAYKIAYDCHLVLKQDEAAETILNQIHLIDPTIAVRYFKAAQ